VGGGTPSTPSGSVRFSQNHSGTFNPSTCLLSRGSCSVLFTPSPGREGQVSITAVYGGNRDHLASSSSVTGALSAVTRPTNASVSCVASQAAASTQISCTATVTDSGAGTAIEPTGTVNFHSSIAGTFSSTSCSLLSGSCSVTFTPSNVVTMPFIEITATYSGDGDHGGSSASTTIQAT
jgi:hypothetical protein